MGIDGEPEEVWEERIHALKPYQVNKHVMELAAKRGDFHALPAGVPRSEDDDRKTGF